MLRMTEKKREKKKKRGKNARTEWRKKGKGENTNEKVLRTEVQIDISSLLL